MVLKDLVPAIIDFFFPPRCMLCGRYLAVPLRGQVCDACLERLCLNDGPCCTKCGILFTSGEGPDHLCGACIARTPLFDRARALGPYTGLLRDAIHIFKYTKQTMLGIPLGRLLAAYGALLFNRHEYELIIPVPLHALRLRRRGFNQSLLLARQIGDSWGIRVSAETLTKNRRTASQAVLPFAQRLSNVRGAFSCSAGRIEGRRVLLVDDVYTTGTTVNECARVLKKNGAVSVDVLTLARTRHEYGIN